MTALLPPITLGGAELAMGDVPAVGQHTDAILAELGYDALAIAALRDSRII
jgi:formyl-CoA transferase